MSIEQSLGANVKVLHKKPWNFKHGTPDDLRYKRLWSDDTYFKFTFLRNPFSRAVSAYFYQLGRCHFRKARGKKIGYYGRKIVRAYDRAKQEGLPGEGFREFIKARRDDYEEALRMGRSAWIPQCGYIHGHAYDFIGCLENIEKDMAYVRKTLGADIKLPHINKSSHKNWESYYDEDSRLIISTIYKEDIDLYKNYNELV
jgi:hypothetical protein